MIERCISHSAITKNYKIFVDQVKNLSSVHSLTHWKQNQCLTFIKMLALSLPKKKIALKIPTQNGELGESFHNHVTQLMKTT